MIQNEPFLIEGEIELVDFSSPIFDATVYVRLLDVSLADMSSVVIAEEIIPHISMEALSPISIPFSMQSPELDKSLTYTLSAHVNVNGKNGINSGDYITTESYPLTSAGLPAHITLNLYQVK